MRVSFRGLDGTLQNFAGRISFVNPMMLAGNRYRIQAEVANRVLGNAWGLEPGRIVAMYILPASFSPSE